MLKLLKIILVHDLVETYAGDVSVWDDKGRANKKKKEDEAAKKLFGMLPPAHGEEFMRLWLEYENAKTDEAKTARNIDGLQAVGQQISSGGRAWKEQNVTAGMMENKSKKYRKESSFDDIWEEFLTEAKERKLFAGKK